MSRSANPDVVYIGTTSLFSRRAIAGLARKFTYQYHDAMAQRPAASEGELCLPMSVPNLDAKIGLQPNRRMEGRIHRWRTWRCRRSRLPRRWDCWAVQLDRRSGWTAWWKHRLRRASRRPGLNSVHIHLVALSIHAFGVVRCLLLCFDRRFFLCSGLIRNFAIRVYVGDI